MYIEGFLLEQTDPYGNVLHSGGARKKIQGLLFRCCKNSCNLSEIRTPAVYGHTKERLFSQMSMQRLCAYIKLLRGVFIFDDIQTILLVENNVIQKTNQ